MAATFNNNRSGMETLQETAVSKKPAAWLAIIAIFHELMIITCSGLYWQFRRA